MTTNLPQCENLQEQVESLFTLFKQEASLRQIDITAAQASLRKAIAPKFEIVFAGAFSAGKSMLINALLERELLYSAEGHATGTECYIEYSEPDKERVVLTFLSEANIHQQVKALCQQLGITAQFNINQTDAVQILLEGCRKILLEEGGESKSERSKQVKALALLLEGFLANRDRILTIDNATYSMEQFNFTNLKEAAAYARRGSNSSVLKRIEYYCYHPLLQDGNVIIDTPGIDAPVKKDAQLTYDKIAHPETSAVVCILKAASSGEMTIEETELLEKTRDNPGVRDRVFYVFNRIDETWYNTQLRQRLENIINTDFRHTSRLYKTSGLLGFYGSLIKNTSEFDRFGLNTIFSDSIKSVDAVEETPQFIYEFNRYCTSNKLPANRFKVAVYNYETPNANYVRILAEQGKPLIEQLIIDSGIEEFRTAITRYLTEEKRPELYQNLAKDLSDVCIPLRKNYQTILRNLDSQPREIDAMKAQAFQLLNQQLQQVGEDFCQHIAQEINVIITNNCQVFETDFRQLQSRMIDCLDHLLNNFSVADSYSRSTLSHPRNSTAPLIAILVEALYYLSNKLEDALVEETKQLVTSLFQWLNDRIRQADYYRQIYHLLGNDGGIEQKLNELEKEVSLNLVNTAKVECDRFVRESPRFYDEGTFSIYQFRQTLQQTSASYDCESMVEAQPAIRQLLRLDFEPKVSQTIRNTFRQTVNQTLKNHLLPTAQQLADQILQQYNQARLYLEQTLEQEAEEKLIKNRQLKEAIEQKVEIYNQAINGINHCLQAMQLYESLLPAILPTDLVGVNLSHEHELDNQQIA